MTARDYALLQLDAKELPASAAVDEAVRQARNFGRSSAAGFVNAVLRNVGRKQAPVLPSEDEAREHARVALSHPPELFDRLVEVFGKEQALAICRHDNREPPVIVRLRAGV